jgi:hypothetical protein
MNLVKYNKYIKGMFTVFFAFVGVLTLSSVALAQVESFSFDVIPKNPEPNSVVKVSINSFSVDLDRAHIKWTINGDLVLSGVGNKKTSFKVGDLGEITLVKVEAIFAGGKKLNKTLVIQPAHLDLLWESADSYTPPFYKGKALPARESTIKITAIPEIKNYGGSYHKPKNLIYTWTKDLNTQSGASGFNKQYFSFKHSVFDAEQRVGVTVTSQDGFSSANGSTLISFVQPFVAVYEEELKKGPDFGKELSQNTVSSHGKTSLVAIPYFFSVKDAVAKDISYKWNINNNKITPPGQKNKLTLQKSGEDAGSAGISVAIQSLTKIFQESSRVFNINLQ